jgi:hypothetical protein
MSITDVSLDGYYFSQKWKRTSGYTPYITLYLFFYLGAIIGHLLPISLFDTNAFDVDRLVADAMIVMLVGSLIFIQYLTFKFIFHEIKYIRIVRKSIFAEFPYKNGIMTNLIIEIINNHDLKANNLIKEGIIPSPYVPNALIPIDEIIRIKRINTIIFILKPSGDTKMTKVIIGPLLKKNIDHIVRLTRDIEDGVQTAVQDNDLPMIDL